MKTIRKDTIFGQRHDRSTRRATKVLYLYFKYMFEILLEQKYFDVSGFFTLKIEKTPVNQKDLQPTPRYYKRNTYLFNEKMLNKNMIGEVVTVSFIPMIFFGDKFRFKICTSFRKKLTRLLFDTDYGKTIALCQ